MALFHNAKLRIFGLKNTIYCGTFSLPNKLLCRPFSDKKPVFTHKKARVFTVQSHYHKLMGPGLSRATNVPKKASPILLRKSELKWPITTEKVATHLSNPPLQMSICSCCMQNCRNSHSPLTLVNFINHTVWKTLRVPPMDILHRMATATEQWIFRQIIPYSNDLLDKPCAKPGLANFIPFSRLDHITLHFWRKLNAPFHL